MEKTPEIVEERLKQPVQWVAKTFGAHLVEVKPSKHTTKSGEQIPTYDAKFSNGVVFKISTKEKGKPSWYDRALSDIKR